MTEVNGDHYMLPDPETGQDVRYLRATRLAGLLRDSTYLDAWKQRMVAQGLAQRPDLLLLASALTDSRELNKVCEKAQNAARADSGANIGTAMHALLERIESGEEDVHIPEPWDRDAEAYLSMLEAEGIHTLRWWIEKRVGLHDIRVAGTLDRVVNWPGSDLPTVADLKTGKSLNKREIGMQLAIYAHAQSKWQDGWHDVDITLDKTTALVFHLPAGKAKCKLVPIDIEQGWEDVQLALKVREFQER